MSQQQCLSLKGSTACPAFGTAYVATQQQPWLINVSTVTEFDHQLLNYVNSTQYWTDTLGCPSDYRARYSVSFMCATLAFSNKSCYQNTTLPIPLCQSTCDLYSQSAQSIISHSCNNSTTLASLSQICTHDGLNGTTSTGCVADSDNNENTLCGFGDDINSLCYYCSQTQPDSPCCRNLNCTDRPGLTGGVIAAIVVSLVVLMSLCALGLFCCIRRRTSRKTYPNDQQLLKPAHLMEPAGIKHGYPIDDEDYMEIVPDIPFTYDQKIHVFKVNSLEKQFVRVIHQLKAPQNPDELELLKGDILRMYYCFDDGWAFGDNFGSGLRGLFPILCVVNLSEEEVQELLYQSELQDEAQMRQLSSGLEYDMDPKSTLRLRTLRRTATQKRASTVGSVEENNFQYLTGQTAGEPPQRTASMHARFNPRQRQDYFR
ncbi:hypothetical protein K501DRAFT_323650 [Backusella circina FSU 941]|nr:hypothetical protein K501DRAFT_323650 [Backusella circina FSU 941]